jgi:hypothetical protein
MNSKKMNHTTSSDKLNFNNPGGNNMNNFGNTFNMNKKKGVSVHDKFKQKPSIIYEESYHGNSSKIIPLKFQGQGSKKNTNLKNLYTKDFHLPSINEKNLTKRSNK